MAAALAWWDERREHRDEVHFRVRAFGPEAQALDLLIVNISPSGLMARTGAALQQGDRLRLTLPRIGAVAAEVRWALGGRVGCQFDAAIDRATYYELLATVLRK